MEIDFDAWNTTAHKLERHYFSNSTLNRQGRHRVFNRCVSATGSSYASIKFESLVCDIADSLDLVIMEFVSNDLKDNFRVGGSQDSLAQSAPKYIEYLFRRFDSLSIPRLFLSASFRVARFDVPTPELENAEDLHLLVQNHFDIPTVSWAKPLKEKFLEAWGNGTYKFWWQNIFYDIWSHQTAAGHYMITFLLLWNVQNDVQYWSSWPFKFIDRAPLENLPNFVMDSTYWVFFSGTQKAQFDYSQPNFQSFNGVHLSADWNFTDEGREKFGLVTYSPGSTISIDIQVEAQLSVVSVGFLRSYANMGKFRLTFFS
jgi:hypothetical protein